MTGKSKADPSANVGDQVVALRSEGKSFASIAKTVGVDRSIKAFELFVAAAAKRPTRERAQLRADENRRLDALERRNAKITDDDTRKRRQAALVKLRAQLIAIA